MNDDSDDFFLGICVDRTFLNRNRPCIPRPQRHRVMGVCQELRYGQAAMVPVSWGYVRICVTARPQWPPCHGDVSGFASRSGRNGARVGGGWARISTGGQRSQNLTPPVNEVPLRPRNTWSVTTQENQLNAYTEPGSSPPLGPLRQYPLAPRAWTHAPSSRCKPSCRPSSELAPWDSCGPSCELAL